MIWIEALIRNYRNRNVHDRISNNHHESVSESRHNGRGEENRLLGIIIADGDVIHRTHEVVNSQTARKSLNEEITSEQEKDHGKEAA
jgi:hypothetical protein